MGEVFWWNTTGKVCVVCYAEWDTGPSRQMLQVAETLQDVETMKIDVEKNEAICEAYDVKVIPTLLVLKDGRLVGKAEGALKPVDILRFVNTEEEEEEEDVARIKFEQKIAKLTNASSGLLDPKDPAVRIALGKFGKFPQAWMNGQLVGHSQEELDSVDKRIAFLVSKGDVVAFIKGSPESPRCGFSRTICGILKERHVDFDHYDILKDQELRQELKVYSNWPTFPQIYVKSQFVGGLDIITQVHQDVSDDAEFLQELEPSS